MSEITEAAQVPTTAVKEEAAPAEVTPKADAVEPVVEIKTETTETPAERVESSAADKPVVPEKYELKLGKGSPLEPGDIAKIEAEAKAQGLSNEQAQKLVEGKEAAFAEFQGRQQESMKSQQKAWVDEIQSDKEIGGKAFKENVEIAHRGLNKFADDAFKKVLSETGLGNNPHLIRTFWRIGKMMENDRAILDGKAGSLAPKKSREEQLYPKMFEKKE